MIRFYDDRYLSLVIYYENGQVPSESNGKMILAARNKNFILSLLDSSREQFSETEYTKIRNSILSAPEESVSDKLTALFYSDTQFRKHLLGLR